MNELSSRYVDTIAINRIIDTKLSKVSHNPNQSLFKFIEGNAFEDIDNINSENLEVKYFRDDNFEKLIFKSPICTAYSENDYVSVIVYDTTDAIGNVVFVHGLYEDNLSIYQFLITMLNKMGLNVYVMMLPYHYDRLPEQSAFSGEYFWSADVARSQWAIKQAVYDLYATYNIVKDKSSLPICITGFSMGGCISLLLASVRKDIDNLFVINSVSILSKLTWESKLLVNIKNELCNYGYCLEDIQRAMVDFEPLSRQNNYLFEKSIALGYGLYDQIILQEDYQYLISNMKFNQVYEYSAGHLNILRVPKLANDILKTFSHIEK
ncbi:alpha/beta hydrolase [Ruminiclostridium herbifermentans]|uniref:Alpha/beta hydrolase n=1 Tax=Ruminiclostridium herbifermentans TaxID=2488810 RepID=A0A4U7J8W9_9FIRM|nr:alpha/beta hydrolase [Ruminiclostridium herbifermentans]QNU66865.1 alpha/beta hydrolase [Ruminiclostridium herbifermentans]